MFKFKTVTGIALVLAVLFAQVGTVFAAPAAQDATLSGTIVSVEPSTPDANGDPTYLITVEDEFGETQTVRVSYDTAVELGLFVLDPNTNEPAVDPNTGEPVLDTDNVGAEIDIDPTTVLPDEETEAEDVHPLATLLAGFFFPDDEENMAIVIDSYHSGDNEAEQVFGFGVIAQALWMARDDEGNTDVELAGDILIAKQSKDFEAFFEDHPEYAEEFGENMPSNWGQFKKVLKDKHENLGNVVSGQADDETTQQEQGKNKKDKDKKNNNGNSHNNNGNGHGQP